MPAGKRRRWKSFVRKVRFVALKDQPLQFYTKSGTQSVTAVANASAVWGRMLGGVQVTNNDELYRTFQQAYNTTVAASTGNKIYIKSMCLDIQITNDKGAGDAEQDETDTVIVDVYHVISRNTFSTATDLGTHFTGGLGDIAVPSGGGSVSTTNVVLNPFMNPSFCKFWKVVKKTELLIPTAHTRTFQVRLPMDRWVEGKIIQQNPQAISGYTRGVLLIARGIPRFNGATSEFGSISMTIGYQTQVTYAIPPGKITEAGSTN